jgi:histidine triad (HIT) family protein
LHNHAPEGYDCPFCGIVRGERGLTIAEHVVLRNEEVTAFIALTWWRNNPGHVVVVPNQHYENLYDLPAEYGTPIQSAAKTIAIAMKKAFQCDAVSTRQHNEPAGNQDVWHYHLHVIPRYRGDRLYELTGTSTAPVIDEELRTSYAVKLREALSDAERS